PRRRGAGRSRALFADVPGDDRGAGGRGRRRPEADPRLMQVVVTGGAGFIGNEVARQLIASGAQVTVVDNFRNGKRENLADIPADRLDVQAVDIRDREKMRALLQG